MTLQPPPNQDRNLEAAETAAAHPALPGTARLSYELAYSGRDTEDRAGFLPLLPRGGVVDARSGRCVSCQPSFSGAPRAHHCPRQG